MSSVVSDGVADVDTDSVFVADCDGDPDSDGVASFENEYDGEPVAEFDKDAVSETDTLRLGESTDWVKSGVSEPEYDRLRDTVTVVDNGGQMRGYGLSSLHATAAANASHLMGEYVVSLLTSTQSPALVPGSHVEHRPAQLVYAGVLDDAKTYC